MKEGRVKCDACGRIVPRSKSVPIYKKRFGVITKVYYCISCAKHRRIPIEETRRRAKQFGIRQRKRKKV